MDRQTILNKLENYKKIDMNSDTLDKMTNKQLEKYLSIIENSFEDYFQD